MKFSTNISSRKYYTWSLDYVDVKHYGFLKRGVEAQLTGDFNMT